MAKGRFIWRRLIKLVIAAFVVGYVLVCAAVWTFQRKLIYFPTGFTADVAEHIGAKEGLLPWRNG